MVSSLDFNNILHSPPFTFLVGPKHTKLTIQSGLARHVSKSLDQLMNGQTRESKHRIAVLEDEDIETLVAFCEFAYTGDYSVPGESRGESRERGDDGVARLGSVSSSASSMAPSYRSVGSGQPEEGVCDGEKGVEENPVTEEVNEAEKWEAAGEEVASVDQLHHPDALAVDIPECTPMATPEEDDPGHFHEVPVPLKSKRAGKSKKRQKGQAGGPQDAPMDAFALSLTPPFSPLQKLEAEPGFASTAVTVTVDEVEATGADAPGAITDEWDQPSPAPPGALNTEATSPDETEVTDEKRVEDNEIPEVIVDEEIIDTSFAKQQFCCPHDAGASLWEEFTSLNYDDDHAADEGRTPSSRSRSSCPDLPYLSFHAKIYIFATRYLAPLLAQLCLRKLHGELLSLSFPDPDDGVGFVTTAKARAVLDLLHYTYSKTTRLEPISPTSATQLRDNELRKLVAHYAACKVKDLAEYCPPMESVICSPSVRPVDGSQEEANGSLSNRSLRGLLDSTTELASDLVYRLMST